MRILLVEDDRAARGSYRRVLERSGHEVFESTSAITAIDLLTTHPIDLVLLDYSIDGTLNGIDVAKCLRRLAVQTGKPAPKIFLLTGYTLDEIKRQALAVDPMEGISFFFHKGEDDIKRLWTAIDQMTGKEKSP